MMGGLAPRTGRQTIAIESDCTVLSSDITGAPSDVVGAVVIVCSITTYGNQQQAYVIEQLLIQVVAGVCQQTNRRDECS